MIDPFPHFVYNNHVKEGNPVPFCRLLQKRAIYYIEYEVRFIGLYM